MPDVEFPKLRPHPAKAGPGSADAGGGDTYAPAEPGYAELLVTSNFTFLRGGSHPEELVERAAELGHTAAAISDTNTLAGIVRAHAAAKRIGIPLAVGCRVELSDGPAVILYPENRAGYARLCRLLTLGKRRAPKGECHLSAHDMVAHAGDLLAIVETPDLASEADIERVRGLRTAFGPRLSLGAWCSYDGEDRARLGRWAALARHVRVPLCAANRVLYHDPGRRRLQDVVTCIRLGTTVEEAGLALEANAERHLKPAEEMRRLFASCGLESAVDRAVEVARRASAFSLGELEYQYPSEAVPPGQSAAAYLRRLCEAGARRRYPAGVPGRVWEGVEYELRMISELGYEGYFLTCHDIVTFARSRGILCQGRGGAANSAVCFVLGLTEVDPAHFDLLFERFISRERNEPPDIDIDFEHERREEVIQYIYDKYGRERAALTAEVITYRGRSAAREVGKAMGLPLDTVDALAKNMDRWGESLGGGVGRSRVREIGLNPDDPVLRRVIELTHELAGFPRHLSQHVGGFVITKGELSDLVPVENAAMEDRTVIEWDKDDIDAMGMLKVDCLGLGMLTVVRRTIDLITETSGWKDEARAADDPADDPDGDPAGDPDGDPDGDESEGVRPIPGVDPAARPAPAACPPPDSSNWLDPFGTSTYARYSSIARDLRDPAVYRMISKADTIGVFQVESRAQMTMLPRLRPKEFYDLVIEVAIVRPGPIQGGMVHPYLRRREGKEPIEYPNEEIRRVLGRTLGVPLFQEQAMRLAIVAAGFTPDEADGLRRAMAAWKRKGNKIYLYGQKLIEGMLRNGYPRDFAERCFEQVKGFSEYGFPESHAASFAILVYVSAWLKRHHPAAFCAALINSQPMGFYAPAQLVRDAREHGVDVRPVDVNRSGWDCTLERGPREGERDPPRPPRPRFDPGGRFGEPHLGTVQEPPPEAWGARGPAVRLGMRLVKGLGEADARKIEAAAAARPAGRPPRSSVEDLWRASGVGTRALRALAEADAFGSMGLDRQRALWQIKPLRDTPMPLFESATDHPRDGVADASVTADTVGPPASTPAPPARACSAPPDAPDTDGLDRLPAVPPPRLVLSDYAALGLSLKAHPVSFLRRRLDERGVTRAADLRRAAAFPTRAPVTVAGQVLCRQRPGTASGVVFITLEDETGIANLVVWKDTFERYRRPARLSTLLMVRGTVEREGEVIHVHARHLESLDGWAPDLRGVSRDFQ